MNISNEQKQDELKRIYKEVECIYKHLAGLKTEIIELKEILKRFVKE